MKALILTAALLAPAAFAADPAPAPAATPAAAPAAAETVPASTCTKPQIQLDQDGKLKNSKELQPQVTAYQNCTDAYIAERKQAVSQHEAAARAHREAANNAVKEFNDFADALRTAQQKK